MPIKQKISMKICLVGTPFELAQDFVETVGRKALNGDHINTVGSEFYTINKIVYDYNIIAQIWIINPFVGFRVIRTQYYLHSHAGIILFDTQDQKSFQNAEQFSNEFYEVVSKDVTNPLDSAPITLVGVRSGTAVITAEEGQALADTWEICEYVEISLQDKEQVERIFDHLLKLVIKKKFQAI